MKKAYKYDPVSLKANLRLASQRCRTLIQKRGSLNILKRKEVAKLLAAGKEESARIQTEFVIREDDFIEALELVDNYCQTLLARFGMIQSQKYLEDESLKEPVYTVIWAAQYMPPEVKELHSVKLQLIDKYQKDLAEVLMDLHQLANQRVVKRLNPDMKAPSKRLVDAYLGEIASSHGIDWSPPAEAPVVEPLSADLDGKKLEAELLAEEQGGVDESSLGFHDYLKQQAAAYQEQLKKSQQERGNTPLASADFEDDLELPSVPKTPPPQTAGGDDSDDEFGDLAERFEKLKK